MSKIKWRSYFDRVYMIHQLSAWKRIPFILAELDRVGLVSSRIFELRYTTPGTYDQAIRDGFTGVNAIQNVGYVNQLLEREKIIRESLELGYSRILILEDDVAFMRDLSVVSGILEKIPDDYEFVQLDKFVQSHKLNEFNSLRPINSEFLDATGHNFTSAAANVYTQSAMSKHIATLKKRLVSNDALPGDAGFRRAVSVHNPCIQLSYKRSLNRFFGSAESINVNYSNIGIRAEDYAAPDGYSFVGGVADEDVCDSFRDTLSRCVRFSCPPSGVWSRFDRIVMLSFTKDRDKRLPLMEEEFDRVGLTGRVEVEWNFPSPLVNIQAKGIGTDWGTSIVDCSLGHYRIIKKAYELGAQNLLVMEDDVRFLKDLDLLREIITTLPDDYDHAKLNWVIPNDEYVNNARHPSPHWVDSNGWGFHSTGMYCMSRRMMEARIRLVESMMNDALAGRKADFRPADLYDKPGLYEEGLQRYACVPQLAVQTDMGDRKCSGGDLNRLQGLTDETRRNYAD